MLLSCIRGFEGLARVFQNYRRRILSIASLRYFMFARVSRVFARVCVCERGRAACLDSRSAQLHKGQRGFWIMREKPSQTLEYPINQLIVNNKNPRTLSFKPSKTLENPRNTTRSVKKQAIEDNCSAAEHLSWAASAPRASGGAGQKFGLLGSADRLGSHSGIFFSADEISDAQIWPSLNTHKKHRVRSTPCGRLASAALKSLLVCLIYFTTRLSTARGGGGSKVQRQGARTGRVVRHFLPQNSENFLFLGPER